MNQVDVAIRRQRDELAEARLKLEDVGKGGVGGGGGGEGGGDGANNPRGGLGGRMVGENEWTNDARGYGIT